MRQVFLRRISSNGQTFGVLIEDEIPIVVTLELPNKSNQRDISCIPEGPYVCRRWNSPGHGLTFKIIDVEGRDDILFHVGNSLKDTQGCILAGTMFGELNDEPAILISAKAHDKFMFHFRDVDKFALTIQNSYLYGGV